MIESAIKEYEMKISSYAKHMPLYEAYLKQNRMAAAGCKSECRQAYENLMMELRND